MLIVLIVITDIAIVLIVSVDDKCGELEIFQRFAQKGYTGGSWTQMLANPLW